MFILAFFIELLVGGLFLFLFEFGSQPMAIYIISVLLMNLLIYHWGFGLILNRLNANEANFEKEWEQIKNISYKLNTPSPQFYRLAEFPYDLITLIAPNGRLVICIGSDLVKILTQPEVETLLAFCLGLNKSRLRYFQWLTIKTEVLITLLRKISRIKFLGSFSNALVMTLTGKLNARVINKLKEEKLALSQDLLLKLNRKKNMGRLEPLTFFNNSFLVLSMTEGSGSELVTLIT